MKKYLLTAFFILLCRPLVLSAQSDLNLGEYIDSLPVERTTRLSLNMSIYPNCEVPSNIARLVNLKEIVVYNSTAEDTSKYRKCELINLPNEMFALPALKTLSLKGPCQYRLKESMPGGKTSDIRILNISNQYKDIIDFWPVFANLEELNISFSALAELNKAVYYFKNLKHLRINNNSVNVKFSESLTGLSSLESIQLDSCGAFWPEDLSAMSSLKEVYTEYCGYAPERYSDNDYYFPRGLSTLPNLEHLSIIPFGRLELPPRGSGLGQIKVMNFLSYRGFAERVFSTCPQTPLEQAPADNIRRAAVTNLNNITDYNSLESISIDVYVEETDLHEGRRRFEKNIYPQAVEAENEGDILLARKIKAAFKAGNMPNLRSIYLPGHEGPDLEPVFHFPGLNDCDVSEAVDNF